MFLTFTPSNRHQDQFPVSEPNQGCTISAYTSRKFLVVVCVSLVIFYQTYVHWVAQSTSNWLSSRTLGYSQKGLCDIGIYHYDVFSNLTLTTQHGDLYIGMNCMFMEFHGNYYVCFNRMDTLTYLLNSTATGINAFPTSPLSNLSSHN